MATENPEVVPGYVPTQTFTLDVKGTIKQNGTAVALSGHSHTPSSIGAATMAQVNAAINTAITGAMGASY